MEQGLRLAKVSNTMNLRILFHVYNISGYFIACLGELVKFAEVAVIETPCKGIAKDTLLERVHWFDRTGINTVADLDRLLDDFSPDVFFCGGWADKVCVEYARILHKRGVRTVLLVDTPWQGRIRQFVHCLYSRFYLTATFDFAWVAGAPQEQYLRYLGFSSQRIRRGYYCADTAKFAPIGEAREKRFALEKIWPHVFLYVGRYIAVKNMRRMEHAFIKASEGSNWMLRCIGTGDLWDERTIHPRIEHLGYKRPDEIQDFVKGAGCFVLPSVYEPWGVVVHEAALMGLPMLCSNQVQATTAYLRHDENGYAFPPFDEVAMSNAFSKVMNLSDESLAKMGRSSRQLGMSYMLSNWAQNVLDFL